jgi:hypothetical protein
MVEMDGIVEMVRWLGCFGGKDDCIRRSGWDGLVGCHV